VRVGWWGFDRRWLIFLLLRTQVNLHALPHPQLHLLPCPLQLVVVVVAVVVLLLLLLLLLLCSLLDPVPAFGSLFQHLAAAAHQLWRPLATEAFLCALRQHWTHLLILEHNHAF
jgi:hypothetical protein